VFDKDVAVETWSAAEAIAPWGESVLEIAYAADTDDQAWVAAVASSISRVLGIEVVGAAYQTTEELQTAITGRTIVTAFRTEQHARYPGALSFLTGPYTSKGAANVSGYSSRLFDAQLRAASIATTESDLDREVDWAGVPQYFSIAPRR
jgi:oligopeptide transport system substrate-binding protein